MQLLPAVTYQPPSKLLIASEQNTTYHSFLAETYHTCGGIAS